MVIKKIKNSKIYKNKIGKISINLFSLLFSTIIHIHFIIKKLSYKDNIYFLWE